MSDDTYEPTDQERRRVWEASLDLKCGHLRDEWLGTGDPVLVRREVWWTDAAPPGLWVVYELYDDPSEPPFYVGLTRSFRTRMESHRKRFGERLSFVRVNSFDTEAECKAAETEAIHRWHPVENRACLACPMGLIARVPV